ncbi:MAG: hypothetical protein IPH60_12065 [Flavobacteriales bacterium]|nr:hypothetical protein [Flavobacteriales bacterium]
MNRFFLPLALALILSSCLKDELPVPVHERGDGRITEVCMGTSYQDQLWMDIGTGSVVATNLKTAWDLAFESSPNGWRVQLNGSRLMTAWDRGVVDLAQPLDTVGMFAGRRIDAPSGVQDSTAIGDWRGSDHVFIIDLGYTALGEWLGLRKVRLTSVDAVRYTFSSARLDGSDVVATIVPKDPTRDFTCYSFIQGVVPIEPTHGTWDLVFTQYTHQFYVPFLPYIVTGVLSSPRTRIAVVRNADFADLSLGDTLQYPFEDRRDAIGYLWKTYSFETSSYTIDASLSYIIQDGEGYFHKVRFLEYYSDQGQVGCPRFETEPL